MTKKLELFVKIRRQIHKPTKKFKSKKTYDRKREANARVGDCKRDLQDL